LAAQYHVGVDGLGLLMVLLTAIIVPMAMLASWSIEERVPIHFALILLLQAGLFGTFSALNFFHWFIYWELSLIPAFFLIKLWGGPNRSSAATQFFVYTMVGSIAMLLSFLALYITLIHVQGVTVPTKMFDFATLADLANNGPLSSKFVVRLGWYSLSVPHLALIIFAGAFLGFAGWFRRARILDHDGRRLEAWQIELYFVRNSNFASAPVDRQARLYHNP